MKDNNELKNIVKEKYGEIAVQHNNSCGCGCSKTVEYSVIQDEYKGIKGHVQDADLGLGCGVPTEYAGIKEGDTVVDLGSGAGNDVFVTRAITGDSGKVIGIDFTEAMLEKAKRNNEKLGYKNVEFKMGEIENIPLENSTADVVISNCVLNLVPDKIKAFSEIFRILKPGGHFCVSDIVLKGELPEELKKSAEMYAGCVAGAIQQEEYLEIIKNTGFRNNEIKTTKRTDLPDDILKDYLNQDQIKEFRSHETGIFSITVTADK
ncbi:MAG: arsenite methyltransferase [Ignavibacteriaceae bacterium]